LMEENFYHNTYFMNDEFIRKVERSISNQNILIKK
jgi:hypothetical protein